MILSFADKLTEDLFNGVPSRRVRKLDNYLVQSAFRKLDMLNSATTLEDLRSPPGNRLEALRGDLDGHYSIRVNDQWRFVFRWTPAGPDAVRFLDYHS